MRTTHFTILIFLNFFSFKVRYRLFHSHPLIVSYPITIPILFQTVYFHPVLLLYPIAFSSIISIHPNLVNVRFLHHFPCSIILFLLPQKYRANSLNPPLGEGFRLLHKTLKICLQTARFQKTPPNIYL